MLSSLQHSDPKHDHSDTSSSNSPTTPNANPKPMAELAWPTQYIDHRPPHFGWAHHGSIWTDHPLISPLLEIDTTFTLDQNKSSLIDRYPQPRRESALYAALPSIWAAPDPESEHQQRRFSVAEPRVDYWTSLAKEIRPFEEMSSGLVGRRHSVAGPYVTAQDHPMLTDSYIQRQVLNKDLLDHIDEYLGPRGPPGSSSSEPVQSLGKGVLLQNFDDSNSLYRVEFKAGRTEVCYVIEGPQLPKVGDLVIVEADRGRDLGVVIADSLTPDEVMATLGQGDDDKPLHSKDVHVKRLYRIATPNETSTLALKEQDEAKALGVCQAKLKQRNMAMEVVNAEYQWDRRKLTFYFVAEQRIDFRELVRELFKIYKTRIWMCAVKTTDD
ncbi:PSP1 C-terminal conserved region-domain-containing protein [Phycomyces nitens]|nr:PSP1 C-terminal conserved region-domain-containing protein [Phycomyces nitens]